MESVVIEKAQNAKLHIEFVQEIKTGNLKLSIREYAKFLTPEEKKNGETDWMCKDYRPSINGVIMPIETLKEIVHALEWLDNIDTKELLSNEESGAEING